jgi:hypothetical protein
VSLKTCGGNQSWSGIAKEIDPSASTSYSSLPAMVAGG